MTHINCTCGNKFQNDFLKNNPAICPECKLQWIRLQDKSDNTYYGVVDDVR